MRFRWAWVLAVLVFTVPAVADLAPASNVRLRCPHRCFWVRKALDGAARRLARPECGRLLSEFRDGEGRSLRENLEALGLDAPTYVRGYVFFYDGADRGTCERASILAVTEPHSHVVHVCPRFSQASRTNPRLSEAILIHEALHTLGLGENPPSSAEITRRVLKACG